MTKDKPKTEKHNMVENHFDMLFSSQETMDYKFEWRKMGRKDQHIVNELSCFGIKGKSCLDVGPGSGRWVSFLKQNQADYLAAIDISDQSLKRCGPNCNKTQKADLEKDRFSFEDHFFDVVLSFEVIEHLVNPGLYLSEIKRVLKSEGLLLMSTPNLVSLMSRFRMLLGRLPTAMASDKTHVRFYSQSTIRTLFDRYDMDLEFLPTAICLNPSRQKSRFSIPSFSAISGLDDNLLFKVTIRKSIPKV